MLVLLTRTFGRMLTHHLLWRFEKHSLELMLRFVTEENLLLGKSSSWRCWRFCLTTKVCSGVLEVERELNLRLHTDSSSLVVGEAGLQLVAHCELEWLLQRCQLSLHWSCLASELVPVISNVQYQSLKIKIIKLDFNKSRHEGQSFTWSCNRYRWNCCCRLNDFRHSSHTGA